MAQSLGFTGSGQIDVSNERLVSQHGLSTSNVLNKFSKGHAFGSFEQASVLLKNAAVHENNENGKGGLFSFNNQRVHESVYIAPSERSQTLDPLEQKLLFNMDDNPWDISSGKCVELDAGNLGNAFGHTNGSMHRGSWSALMQSTLAETSKGDTGMQEEWSGLNFQNAVITANILSAAPIISPSVPRQSLLQRQQVSNLADDSPPVQTAMYTTATGSSNFFSQHYADSDTLPVSQPATQWTAVTPQNNSAGGRSEIVQESDFSSEDVEIVFESFKNQNEQGSENVTPWGSFSKTDLKHEKVKSQLHILSKVLDPNGSLTSEMQESMKDIGGCSVKNNSMNQMTATNFPANTVADMTDHPSLANSRPNKRKSPTYELLPWHIELVKISVILPDKRMEERKWAQATDRLIEAEIDAELCKPDHSINRPRKRLIMTTRLMQKLLLPASGTILSQNASMSYESVVYLVARLLLADACSMSSACDKANHTDKIDTEENLKINGVINSYNIRIKQLEDNMQRLDSRRSFIDIKVQYLELERFSVINRFAKFHSRTKSNPSGVVSSNPSNIYLHKYVAAQPMPKDLPDGLQCVEL